MRCASGLRRPREMPVGFRVLTGEFAHETNTFSVVPTMLDNFRRGHLLTANEIPAQRRGTRSSLGATFEAADKFGWTLIHPLLPPPLTRPALSRPLAHSDDKAKAGCGSDQVVGGQYAVASTGPGLGGPQSRATGGPATIPAYDVVLSFFVSLIPSDPIRTSWPALIAPFHNSVPLADTRLVAPIAFYISAASIDDQ